MSCLVLTGPKGERRIPHDSNPPYGYRYGLLPGEAISGIDPDCGGTVILQTGADNNLQQLLTELDAELGQNGLGDWVKVFAAPVAKTLGKGSCAGCEVRRVIGNAYAPLRAAYGRIKALTIIKDLVVRSFTEPELDVLKELYQCYKEATSGQNFKEESGSTAISN